MFRIHKTNMERNGPVVKKERKRFVTVNNEECLPSYKYVGSYSLGSTVNNKSQGNNIRTCVSRCCLSGQILTTAS